MKRYKITYSYQAKRDLKDIYDFIAIDQGEPTYAKKVILEIREKIRGLSILPEGHPTVDFAPYIRSTSIRHHRIFFIVRNLTAEVVIARVLHSHRNVNTEDLSQ